MTRLLTILICTGILAIAAWSDGLFVHNGRVVTVGGKGIAVVTTTTTTTTTTTIPPAVNLVSNGTFAASAPWTIDDGDYTTIYTGAGGYAETIWAEYMGTGDGIHQALAVTNGWTYSCIITVWGLNVPAAQIVSVAIGQDPNMGESVLTVAADGTYTQSLVCGSEDPPRINIEWNATETLGGSVSNIQLYFVSAP